MSGVRGAALSGSETVAPTSAAGYYPSAEKSVHCDNLASFGARTVRYTSQIVIAKSRAEVAKLYEDTETMKSWQPGLVSFEPLSGEPRTEGARSKIVYDEGGRTIAMEEVVVGLDPPNEYTFVYTVRGVHNVEHDRFISDGRLQTTWIKESEFTFSGVLSLLMPFMRRSLKKATRRHMERFKKFAESREAR